MRIEPEFRSTVTEFALRFYDVSIDEVLSRSLSRHVVHARAMIVWLARTYRPKASFAQIGDWLGKPHDNTNKLYHLGHRLKTECPHFARAADEFAALYRTTMEAPYACA